ncbi:MAG: nucleotidyltransferase family protein [Candidatus Yanofskybacteria bacterium]|nr:nucleotidyltransferase family protein [Candidatus Yanofskybacteria bacterium]
MKAIILAAGKGTRFGDITKKTPKALIKVSGKPIIEYTLDSLPSRIKEVFLVIGHLGAQIKKHVGKEYKGIKITYIELKNLTGTATAVYKARKYLGKEKFLVLYGDDIYSKKELGKLVRFKWAFGLAKTIPPTSKYLNMILDSKQYIIQALYPTAREMKTGILVSTGAYVMNSRIFKYKPVKLSNGEYGLPQTMLAAAKDTPIKGVVMKNWLQINSPADIKRAEKILK